jgi:4-amino-4-deoxy-L-arabinose transferase-like glycosyltransferase
MLIAGMFFGPGVALLAGALMAVYPPLVLYSVLKLGESLFTFLFCVLCYLLVKGINEKRNGCFYAAGAVQGVAGLVRSTPALLPFFLFAYLFVSRSIKPLIKGFLVYFLVSTSIMAVWTVRNYRVFDMFIPVNVGSGHLLWLTVQDDAWDGDRLVTMWPSREYKDLENVPRRVWEKEVTKRVFSQAAAHPLVYSKKFARNFVRLWTLPVGKVMLEKYSENLAEAYKAAHIALMLLALYGVLTSVRNVPSIMPLLLFLIYLAVMHTLFIAVPRYRLPFEPFILIFLAKGLTEAGKGVRSLFFRPGIK